MTPQDFEDRVNAWRIKLAALGLSHWRFDFDYSEAELEDTKGREAEAAVRVHENYDTAHWHVRPGILASPTLEIDTIIVHELLHVAMRDLNSVEYDVLEQIGGHAGSLLGDRLESAVEALVERLARAIVGASSDLVP